MKATIEVAGLRKRFGPTVALDGMSFTVAPGQVTGFIGPNGAGKSTTMRVILGLDAPDAGQARVGGRRFGDLRWPLREAGALLEVRAFHPGRSARDRPLALPAEPGAAGPGRGRRVPRDRAGPAGRGHGGAVCRRPGRRRHGPRLHQVL